MFKQLFTLRNHKSSVTCISSVTFDEAYVVSGDKDGNITVWDTSIRRSKYNWKGHTDSILSILQWRNYLVTHGRDSSIKFWKFDNQKPEEILEIPINCLNFCNIDIYNDYVFTPATTNSNNFDCYKIDAQNLTISRIITDFNCYKLIHHDDIIEINANKNLNLRNDFGIIMKLQFLPDLNHLVVGFESGDLIVVKIDWNNDIDIFNKNDRLILNKDPRVLLIYHNNLHSPNPITCICFDNDLFTGSTTKKILKHDVAGNTCKIISLNHAGVLLIITMSNKILIIGFWNGLIEIRFDHNEPVVLSRPTPSETLLETPKANLKLSSMVLYKPQIISPSNNSYRNAIKSKRNMTSPVLFAGYEDGVVAAYYIDAGIDEPLSITEIE
jgi:WD40 repeat protein